MAEVGVLDLQIHDNSAKAAAGLNNLASALERVRSAVGSGKQLSGVSNDLEKINNAVAGATGGKATKSLGDLGKKVSEAKQATSGFVEVSSRIEETMSDVGGTVADATDSVRTYTSSIKEAQKATEAVGKTANKSWKSFNPETGGFDPDANIKGVKDVYAGVIRANEEAARVNDIKRQASELKYGLDNPEPMNYGDFLKQSMNIEGPVKSAEESMGAFLQAFENMDGMTEVESRIAELNPELQDLATNGESSKTSIQKLKEALFGADSEIKGFGDAVNSMLPSLSAMAKQMESIARRMALRAIIKQVTAGFKEGVQNLYQYSNAVGTSFAPAMDSAASTMLQFKNSIGAAVAPAIEALIPVLQTVVNWMITAINYVNQFLALISGKSGWTKAVPAAASAFDDASKKAKSAGGSAKKAAKDVKELLADWDELNIIQSESGGGSGSGGGGGGAGSGLDSEFASMFQEIKGFDKEIQAFVKNLEDSFGSVLDFAKEIGAAVLAWKVSSAFAGVVGDLAGLAGAFVTLDIVFKLTKALDKTYAQTGSAGWLVADVLTGLIGGTLVKKILGNVLGGKYAELALPITLAVSAAATIKATIEETDLSALNERTIAQSVTAALKGGAAIGMVAKKIGGLTMLSSIGAAISGTLITFGAALGIKATKVVADTGEITKETVLADVTSTVATALGVGGLALALGATVGTAAALGAGALVFTAAALVAIQTTLEASKDNVQWGDVKLTDEQIEAFVNEEMFSIDVHTTAKVITDKVITPSQTERAALEDKLTTMLGDWKIIQLGVADAQDYKNLQSDVDDVVDQIGECIDVAKEAGKLTIQFVPTLAGETETEQANWLSNYTKGWETVDNWATNTGKRIGELISKAENNALEGGEAKLLETLMSQMSRVSDAIARSKLSSEAFGNFVLDVGKIDMENVNEETFSKIATSYGNYLSELRASLNAQAVEQLAQQQSLVDALFEFDPNGDEYKNAKADLDRLAANLVSSVDASVKKYSASGANWLLNMLKEKYAEYIPQIADGTDIYGYFSSNFNKEAFKGKSAEELADYINRWLGFVVAETNSDLNSFLESAGIADWNILETSTRESIRAAMEAALGPDLTNEIIKLWEINNPVEEAISNAEEPQVETAATVDATVKENVTYETVGENVNDAAKGATGDLPASVGEELAATDTTISTHTFPATSSIDTSATTDSARQMRDDVAAYVSDTIAALNTLNSLSGGFSFSGGGGRFNGLTGVSLTTRATGGNIRSGEAFFANENGNIEMMGKMGNSTVVANNQQIVEGISRGVAASNSGMESSMSMMVTLMRQFLNKDFTARVVPSSAMGRNNSMSAEAYRKVTG